MQPERAAGGLLLLRLIVLILPVADRVGCKSSRYANRIPLRSVLFATTFAP
jgi:hypothetical protein